jgi:hypothetical protein
VRARSSRFIKGQAGRRQYPPQLHQRKQPINGKLPFQIFRDFCWEADAKAARVEDLRLASVLQKGAAIRTSPPVVPVIERRALPASLEPTIAMTPRRGPTPSGSAPSVGSRPSDPDGRTRGGTTDRTAAPSIPTNRTWFGNRPLSAQATGVGLGSYGRSISDLFILIGFGTRDLSRDKDRADNQDRSQDTAPRHSIPSTQRSGANDLPWRRSPGSILCGQRPHTV